MPGMVTEVCSGSDVTFRSMVRSYVAAVECVERFQRPILLNRGTLEVGQCCLHTVHILRHFIEAVQLHLVFRCFNHLLQVQRFTPGHLLSRQSTPQL